MGFAAVRTEATTVLFPDVAAPRSFLVSWWITVLVNLVGIVFFTWSSFKVWRAFARSRGRARRTLRELLCQVVTSACMNLLCVSLVVFKFSWQVCSVVGGVAPAWYVMAHFFCYRVLALRAESVVTVMPWWYALLLRGIRLCLLGVIPLNVTTFIVFSGKLVFEEEYCTQNLNRYLPIVADFVDSLVSASLLFLFVAHVQRQAHMAVTEHSSDRSLRARGDQDTTRVLRKVATQNLLLSSVPILTTFMYLIVIILIVVSRDSVEREEMQHWRNLTLYGAGFDTIINAGALLALYRKLLFPPKRQTQKRVAPASKSSTLLDACSKIERHAQETKQKAHKKKIRLPWT